MRNFLIMQGGLGNQMFQYAFLIAVRKSGYHVVLDTSYFNLIEMHNGYELERVFGIKEQLYNKQGIHMSWLRLLNRLQPSNLCTIDSLVYSPATCNNLQRYIYGYWQDERYFKEISDEILSAFSFKNIDDFNSNVASEMSACNSVSLHIRRGDYLEYGVPIIKKVYYERAIAFIKKNVKAPIFYIFSDDVRESENIADSLGINYKIMTHNRGEESYKDMFLMSQCHHNIIANSSFSWWGAWLNNSTNKIVISPEIWDFNHKELKPQVDNWIKIKNY